MGTECCQCGRKYWPGKGACPGRPIHWIGHQVTQATGCGHEPCEKCKQYTDEKEKEYERK